METKKIISVIGVILGGIIIILLMFRFIYGSPEDKWVCDGSEWVKHGSPRDPKPDTECIEKEENNNESKATSIENDSSIFCLDQGGMLAFRMDESGNQYGVCIFDDGRECEKLEFYNTRKCGDVTIPQ